MLNCYSTTEVPNGRLARYRAIWMYARYFRAKHPSIYENERAMENLLIVSRSQAFYALPLTTSSSTKFCQEKVDVTISPLLPLLKKREEACTIS